MLEAKLAGQEITAPEPAPEAPVVDLLEALRRSVAESKEKKTTKARKGKAAEKAPARSRARAKAS
jgi:non-homologous end joining protein Ku